MTEDMYQGIAELYDASASDRLVIVAQIVRGAVIAAARAPRL